MIRRLSFVISILVLVTPALLCSEELDQHGQAHQWRGASDGYTVIDFAASWCAPCRKVLPRLETFARQHPDIRVLVVSVDDREKGRDRLVQSLELRLPVLWDKDYRIAELYEPKGMPATFVIDPQGAVIYAHVGAGTREWKEFVAFAGSLEIE